MTSMRDESSAGPSSWERRLYAHLGQHIETEQSLLDEYLALARAGDSQALDYLIGLLVTDETRHHRLFQQLAESLETEALSKREEPVVPYLDFGRLHGPLTVIDGAYKLLQHEKQDARELKRLRRELLDVNDTSLWGLLVEMMERDTQNHIAVLNFIIKHMKSAKDTSAT